MRSEAAGWRVERSLLVWQSYAIIRYVVFHFYADLYFCDIALYMYISIYLNRLVSWLVTPSCLLSTMFPRLNETLTKHIILRTSLSLLPPLKRVEMSFQLSIILRYSPNVNREYYSVLIHRCIHYTSLSREPFALAPDKVPKATRKKKERNARNNQTNCTDS